MTSLPIGRFGKAIVAFSILLFLATGCASVHTYSEYAAGGESRQSELMKGERKWVGYWEEGLDPDVYSSLFAGKAGEPDAVTAHWAFKRAAEQRHRENNTMFDVRGVIERHFARLNEEDVVAMRAIANSPPQDVHWWEAGLAEGDSRIFFAVDRAGNVVTHLWVNGEYLTRTFENSGYVWSDGPPWGSPDRDRSVHHLLDTGGSTEVDRRSQGPHHGGEQDPPRALPAEVRVRHRFVRDRSARCDRSGHEKQVRVGTVS